MKLSYLKALIAAAEADAAKHGTIDPDVSFWPTTETEKVVMSTMPKRGVFVDMVPEAKPEDIWLHRVTKPGKTFGDYNFPLVVFTKES